MTIDNKFRDEKLQYDINREGAKIPELSYETLVNMNILQAKKYQNLI